MRKLGLSLVLHKGLREVGEGCILSLGSWDRGGSLTGFSYSPTCATSLFVIYVALVYVSGEEITGGVADKVVTTSARAAGERESARRYLLANWSPQWTHL